MVDIRIVKTENPARLPDEAKLDFGNEFTDHMFLINYKDGAWHDPRIVPFADLPMHPASLVFHYGQEIFEGLKAYRRQDEKIQLFRPECNMERLNLSAERMALPQIDLEDSLAYLKEYLRVEERWVPYSEGTSLYLRPFMIATDPTLGVKPCNEALFAIIASPSGPFYGEDGIKPVKIRIEERYVRAVKGGTGVAKCGGNYGGQMKASREALADGYGEVLWLDGVERKYIEEVGAMNIMFVIDGTIVTPELSGSILSGVTRRSILELLRDEGYQVEERKISIDELTQKLEEGRVEDAFGTGTAAVIAPIKEFTYKDRSYQVGDGQSIGKVAQFVYDRLTDIQRGLVEDTYGWTVEV